MNRIVFPLLMLGLSFAPLVSWAAERNADEAKAIAEIERLGGKVTVDEKNPGRPVVAVDFTDTQVTDAGLEHLTGLTKLQSLNLEETQITDAGLTYL
jgi:internalin A